MNRFQFPRWNELPSLDLYMDQVITYLQSNLESTYFFDEKFITKAMINNYVKTSIVAPPIKKHYTKQHIAYFIVVTILKRCYSMSQISQLIEIHTHMESSSVEQAYDLFISLFEDSLNDLFSLNETEHAFISTNQEQKLMEHVIQCIVYKIHTEYVLSQK